MGRKDDERKGRIISGRKDDEKGRKGKEEGRLWSYIVDRRDRRGEMHFTPPFKAFDEINADADTLGSPSSSIVLGKAPRMGTGAFEVRPSPPKPPPPAAPHAAAKRKPGEKAAAKAAAKAAKVDKV